MKVKFSTFWSIFLLSVNGTTLSKLSPKKSPGKVATVNSPLKLKQLKTFLNNRDETPVRKTKQYNSSSSSLIVPRSTDDSTNITNLGPSFTNFPKAASTPAPAANQGVGSPKKVGRFLTCVHLRSSVKGLQLSGVEKLGQFIFTCI